MKKILLLLMLFPLLGFTQITIDDATVNIKNYSGIEIKGHYKLLREKDGKKEYKIWVTFKNSTDQDVFYKYKNQNNFGTVTLEGLSSYTFNLEGDKATKKILNKKIRIVYPAKDYECKYSYEKWYNGNETPEFVFVANSDITIENDYKRYEK